jgi:hypothetical protein
MIELKALALKDAINSLRKAVGALDVVQIKATSREKLIISGKADGAFGTISVAANIDQPLHFAADADLLLKICTGRGDITFVAEGNEIRFKGRGSYQGNFSTLQPEDITAVNSRVDKHDTEYFSYIAKHYLPKLQISNIKDSSAILALMLRGDGTMLKLAVTDMLHLAIITCRSPLKINQNIPLPYTMRLSSLLQEGGGYDIQANRMYCWNSSLDLSLPLQSDLIESWSVVTAMESLGEPLISLHVDIAELRKVCHNLSAVYEGSNAIALSFNPQGMMLSCTGSNGSIKDLLPVSYNKAQALDVNLSMSLLSDILDGPLQNGTATLTFHKSNAALVMAIEAIAPDNNSRLKYYLLALASGNL